jgi:hypothetical protein
MKYAKIYVQVLSRRTRPGVRTSGVYVLPPATATQSAAFDADGENPAPAGSKSW